MGKAHSSYTISDMKRLDLSFLKKDKTEAQVSVMRKNIRYLGDISNQMGHNSFGGKSFLDLFDEKPFYEYSQQDINKVIYESLEIEREKLANATDSARQLQTLEDSMASGGGEDYFKAEGKDKLERDIANEHSNIASHARNIENYQGRIDDELYSIRESNTSLENLETLLEKCDDSPVDARTVEAIREVVARGDWVYLGTGGVHKLRLPSFRYNETMAETFNGSTANFRGHLFLTSKPVVTTYVNNAANVSMQVDFGHFLVGINMDGKIIKACPVINTLGGTGHSIHPHLNSPTGICWGNAQYKYNELSSGGMSSLPTMLGLFKSLMETYCPDAPYRTLKNYYRYRDRRYDTILDVRLLAKVPMDIITDPELRTRLECRLLTKMDELVEYWFDYANQRGMVESDFDIYISEKMEKYDAPTVQKFMSRISAWKVKEAQEKEEKEYKMRMNVEEAANGCTLPTDGYEGEE